MGIIIALIIMLKNLKNILCLIVILLLTVSCLFLYSEYQKNSSNIKSLNQKIINLEKRIEETKNTPPLGWNEYTDDKYKFKIWYPEEVNDNVYGQSTVRVGTHGNLFFYLESPKTQGDVPPVVLDIYIYITDLDIREFMKNDMEKRLPYEIINGEKYWFPSQDYSFTNKESMKKYSDSEIISNIQQIKSGNIELYSLGEKSDYYLKKDNLVFAFIHGYAGSVDYQQMYETMVKSFQFTN